MSDIEWSTGDNMKSLRLHKPLASHTVASFYVQCLLQACQNCGLDRGQLIALSSLSIAKLNDPESRFNLMDLKGLWQHIIQTSHDPCIGLKIGLNMPAGHWGLIETLALNSNTLGEAFTTSLKYWSLVTDTGKEFHFHKSGDLATLSFISAYYDYSYANESDIVYLVRLIKLILGQDIKLHEVHLTHALPGNLTQRDYQDYLDAPIVFEQKRNAIVVTDAILHQPIAGSNSQIKYIVDQLSLRKLNALKKADSTSDKVMAYINHGITELESIAAELYVSSRTLQRKLKAEGQSFQLLLDKHRRDKTETLMTDGTYTFQQISFLIGYRDERAFYDAVRRWFGATPTEAAQRIRNNSEAL